MEYDESFNYKKEVLDILKDERAGHGRGYYTYDFRKSFVIHYLRPDIIPEALDAMVDIKHLISDIFDNLKHNTNRKVEVYNKSRQIFVSYQYPIDYFCIGKIDMYRKVYFRGNSRREPLFCTLNNVISVTNLNIPDTFTIRFTNRLDTDTTDIRVIFEYDYSHRMVDTCSMVTVFACNLINDLVNHDKWDMYGVNGNDVVSLFRNRRKTFLEYGATLLSVDVIGGKDDK